MSGFIRSESCAVRGADTGSPRATTTDKTKNRRIISSGESTGSRFVARRAPSRNVVCHIRDDRSNPCGPETGLRRKVLIGHNPQSPCRSNSAGLRRPTLRAQRGRRRKGRWSASPLPAPRVLAEAGAPKFPPKAARPAHRPEELTRQPLPRVLGDWEPGFPPCLDEVFEHGAVESWIT